MTIFTEGRHPLEFLLSEAEGSISREARTIAAGSGVLAAGTILGRILDGAATAAVKASGANTGTGTISAVSLLGGAKTGLYTVRFTAATVYTVEDPDGFVLATNGATGTAFADDLAFTITAGGTPFAAGDGFDITVAAGSLKFVPSPDTGTDGSQVGAEILAYPVDATSADVKATTIARLAEVNAKCLSFHSSIGTDAAKQAAKIAQLAASQIIAR